jgi:hypothetical protein
LHNFRAINEFLKVDLLTLSLKELKEIESAVAGLYNIESAKILARMCSYLSFRLSLFFRIYDLAFFSSLIPVI